MSDLDNARRLLDDIGDLPSDDTDVAKSLAAIGWCLLSLGEYIRNPNLSIKVPSGMEVESVEYNGRHQILPELLEERLAKVEERERFLVTRVEELRVLLEAFRTEMLEMKKK